SLLRAASSASRVLPIPPGPVSVSRRQVGVANKSTISASSSSLPMKGVIWAGKLEIGIRHRWSPVQFIHFTGNFVMYHSKTGVEKQLGKQKERIVALRLVVHPPSPPREIAGREKERRERYSEFSVPRWGTASTSS